MAASIARAFHLEGKSKIEIGAELGISRYKVARVLQQALDRGIVTIDINLPEHISGDLSYELQQRFGLRQAIVVAADEPDEKGQREALARVAADFLTETTTASDVLGVTWSRTLVDVARIIESLAPCTLIQASGAMIRPDIDDNAVELVRRLARVAGGKAIGFYAPLLAATPEAAKALRGSDVRKALEMLDDLTRVVLSVGRWAPGESAVHDALSATERDALTGQGAFAETCGILFDEKGRVLDGLSDRTVGLTYAQLKRTPDVVAIVQGVTRAPAVRALLEGGVISTLITPVDVARAVLGEADGGLTILA
jgi:DNA-binding transcriptional regulator LsrR (DeoR family)